jgi:hypothetical protein
VITVQQWAIIVLCGSVGGVAVWLTSYASMRPRRVDYVELSSRIIWGAISAAIMLAFAPDVGLQVDDNLRRIIGFSLSAGLGLPGMQLLGARLGIDVRQTIRLGAEERRGDDDG